MPIFTGLCQFQGGFSWFPYTWFSGKCGDGASLPSFVSPTRPHMFRLTKEDQFETIQYHSYMILNQYDYVFFDLFFSVDGRNPAPAGMFKSHVYNEIFTISTDVGFLPSTVVHLCSFVSSRFHTCFSGSWQLQVLHRVAFRGMVTSFCVEPLHSHSRAFIVGFWFCHSDSIYPYYLRGWVKIQHSNYLKSKSRKTLAALKKHVQQLGLCKRNAVHLEQHTN